MTDVRSFIEIDIPLPSTSTVGTIPNVTSISVTPSVIDPGVSIGQRASVSVSFRDVQYPLVGSSFFSGSFWGKLRALRRSLQGLPMRIIRQVADEYVTEHYIVETLSRSGAEEVTIVGKDLFKVADSDRAQAPSISHGRVLADFDEAALTFTLTPSGIGNLEYPPSGKVALGGSEIVEFTRVDDVMTIVRAQSGTVAKEHDADEIVQSVLIYSGLSPAVIFYNLLSTYTEINADWLPLAEWQEDIDTYIGRLYSAEIAAPTPVKTLLDELVEQCGMVTWWDALAQKVRLKSLRPVTGARVVSTDEMMADTFSFQEQPGKRVSEIWTHFALRNPLVKLDDPSNYRSTLVSVDPNADADYNDQPAIRKIFSRWIAINNRPAASRLNSVQISRYRDPPRKFSFELYITSVAPSLGQGLELEHWALQDEDGATITAPVQVTSVERNEDHFMVDAEEMLFSGFVDPNDPDGSADSNLIIIDADTFNVNLRELHDSFYVPAEPGDEVLCIIESDATIGSTSPSLPSFDIGTWDSGVIITVRLQGRIQGMGGIGGEGGFNFDGFPTSGDDGTAGGTALYTRYPFTLDSTGEIYGGGGGGGGGVEVGTQGPGGGGGAGVLGGPGGHVVGNPGTRDAGGAGWGSSGGGGGPGSAGTSGVGGGSSNGGAAGNAIDGVSFISIVSGGSVLGPMIN